MSAARAIRQPPGGLPDQDRLVRAYVALRADVEALAADLELEASSPPVARHVRGGTWVIRLFLLVAFAASGVLANALGSYWRAIAVLATCAAVVIAVVVWRDGKLRAQKPGLQSVAEPRGVAQLVERRSPKP